ILAQLVEPIADTDEGDLFVFAGDELVGKYSDIRRVEFMGEIDEASRLVHVLGSFNGVRFVHLGGSAEIGNREVGGGEVLQCAFQRGSADLGAFRQVHLS